MSFNYVTITDTTPLILQHVIGLGVLRWCPFGTSLTTSKLPFVGFVHWKPEKLGHIAILQRLSVQDGSESKYEIMKIMFIILIHYYGEILLTLQNRNLSPIFFSSFIIWSPHMIHHRIFNMGNMKGTTSGSGTAYPFRASELIPSFNWVICCYILWYSLTGKKDKLHYHFPFSHLTSICSDSARPRRANFEAEYAVKPNRPSCPAWEERNTILPLPRAFILVTTAFVTCTLPK